MGFRAAGFFYARCGGGIVTQFADCGASLPPQDAATGDSPKPWLFGASFAWKKGVDRSFHCPLAALMPGLLVAGEGLWKEGRGKPPAVCCGRWLMGGDWYVGKLPTNRFQREADHVGAAAGAKRERNHTILKATGPGLAFPETALEIRFKKRWRERLHLKQALGDGQVGSFADWPQAATREHPVEPPRQFLEHISSGSPMLGLSKRLGADDADCVAGQHDRLPRRRQLRDDRRGLRLSQSSNPRLKRLINCPRSCLRLGRLGRRQHSDSPACLFGKLTPPRRLTCQHDFQR